MAEIMALPEQVSAQAYMMNHLVDADDEEDVTLHLAALCGDSEGLRHIAGEIHYSQWLNYRVRPYMSPPLRLAVSGGNPECIEVLLSAGADIELEDVKGQTSLFVATSQRKLEIMKILLEAGANPEGSRKNRCSPLLVAVRDGFSEGVKLLLQHGADPEPFNQICTCVPGWPLQHAIVYAHFSCYFELIKGGALANLTLLPYQVNPKVVTRLSIPHAILKYAKEYPEFMELYNECGGNLRQVNTAGTTCSEEFLDGSPAKDLLISLSEKVGKNLQAP
ncbi:ankyrin repeat and SOCS box protein 12-like isoform X2 [Homarus americanus]|uniref:ankyrin repeat and SOCS box protein 12-like isoform X2 n=1 Tax=Homarus americanus TaxID=6706 RepID=UPI001C439BF2|nr:ankyrin repeat and SOCS box protein 12-like isoform X2 [Homarus americanus]XP_042203466.1 ankyrin repeat and SOCS box protein 12-like isoform X2 [Homarus americanus]